MKYNVLLLLAAVIWGFAFVAQRIGMTSVGPFTFNAVRFAIGAIWLVPILHLIRRHKRSAGKIPEAGRFWTDLKGGVLAGCALFLGVSLQQIGLVYTTAGKAGFITGLYVILVPILGLLWHQQAAKTVWSGAALAVCGLFLIGETKDMSIVLGDILVFIAAFFWAIHVQVVGWLSTRQEPVKLACLQFSVCSLLSFVGAVTTETMTVRGIQAACLPILYAGLLSAGVAYTLQVVAQRHVRPTPAAIILSLESVFAVLGGWLIIDESLSTRAALGCLLMFSGMLVSQIRRKTRNNSPNS